MNRSPPHGWMDAWFLHPTSFSLDGDGQSYGSRISHTRSWAVWDCRLFADKPSMLQFCWVAELICLWGGFIEGIEGALPVFTHNTIGSAPRLLSSAGRQPLAVTCTCHVWVGLFGAILVGVVPLLASMWLPICLVINRGMQRWLNLCPPEGPVGMKGTDTPLPS